MSFDGLPDGRYTIGYRENDEDEIVEIQNNSFCVNFDLSSLKDVVFGRMFYLKETNHEEDTSHGYCFVLYPKAADIEGIELVETTTGSKIVTTTETVPKTAKLSVSEIVDDPSTVEDPYSVIHNNLGTSYKNIYMYKWSVQYPDGSESLNMSKPVQMKFKIPESWNEKKVQLFGYFPGYGYDPVVDGTLETEEDGSHYFVIETQNLGWYALYEIKDISTTGENLEDGTYSVPISVYHWSIEGQLSMASRCLGDDATLVVKDGVKTIYLNFTEVEQLELTSYMTKMWLYDSDETKPNGTLSGNIIPVVFTSYYRNSDDSYLTDDFNKDTLNYYPKTGYIDLPSDAAQWPARFKVPIMDAIGGGNFEQDAWLTIDWAGATKISDTTPDVPIRDALSEMIQIAETAIQEDYTADSWAEVESAYDDAVEVYQDEKAKPDSMTKAYQTLRTAVDNLETPDTLVLDAGIYTANGTVADTDVVTGTRVLVKEDGGADIYLNVQNIKDFAYYDLEKKAYVAAELEMEEEDGSEVVTRAVLSIPAMSDSVSVKYTDAEGKEQSGLLTLAGFEKQTVDKTELEEAVASAQEKLKEAAEKPEQYNKAAVEALQKAVAEAVKVVNDPVALQTEADTQTDVLNAAISNLVIDISLKALQTAIASAEQKEESLYTPKSWSTLAEEVTTAKTLLEKEDVTSQEVDEQLLKLNAAMEGLVEKADKGVLQEAYDEAVKITNDANYPGWDNLQAVIAAAGGVLADENASQKDADDAANALNAAISNLNGSVDKSVLNSLIEEAKALDTAGYTEASIASFEAAIASAQSVLTDAGASQSDVDKQILLLQKAAEALIQKAQDNVVYDGIYTIDGRIWHASSDQASMGNAALKKPMQVVVKTDEETGETKATLRMEFGPLTTSLGATDFTGYLAELYYFPGWEGGESGYQMPSGETPVAANIESYYEDTYDVYNHPETGTDANVKGKLYPHIMNIPVELGDNEIWVQVYVPVMEAINQGSGRQYAKLQLDWDSREQISGIETDKEVLEKLIGQAKELTQGNASDAVYDALLKSIAAAQDVVDNMNVDQKAVDNTLAALQAAVDAMTKEQVKTDKNALKEAIEEADSYLNATNVTYTEISRNTLQQARETAQRVYDDDTATQTQINRCVTNIESAIRNLVRIGADKTELEQALANARTYLEDTGNYTAASLEALKSAYDKAFAVYEDEAASQEDTDAQTRILNYLTENLVQVEASQVRKDGLHDLLITAANMSGRESIYTAESIQALKWAIFTAEAVYDNENATQEQVDEQASKLVEAMLNLEQKTTGNGTNGGNGSNNGGNGDGNNNGGGSTGLDIRNLEDGVYSVTGSMVKIDKVTASMSNEAINHTMKLTVKDGKYYITMDFKGLTVGQQLGYLSQLKYFTHRIYAGWLWKSCWFTCGCDRRFLSEEYRRYAGKRQLRHQLPGRCDL